MGIWKKRVREVRETAEEDLANLNDIEYALRRIGARHRNPETQHDVLEGKRALDKVKSRRSQFWRDADEEES